MCWTSLWFWVFPYFCFGFSISPHGSPLEALHPPTCDTTKLPLWHRPHVAPWVTNFQNEHLRFRMVWNWWKCLGFVGEQPSIWKLMILSKKLFVFLIFTQETGKYLIFGDLDIAYRQCSCKSISGVWADPYLPIHTLETPKRFSPSKFEMVGCHFRFCKSAELVSNSSLQIYGSKGIHGKNTLCSSRK